MKEMKRYILVFWCLLSAAWGLAQHWQYVDPRIGSVGVGRTFPGPCMPFGMVKPGPDCGVLPNAGWAPMPQKVTGFSQTHVSGTGGGQKYGNILLMPFVSSPQEQMRSKEDFALGYYTTTFANGIRTIGCEAFMNCTRLSEVVLPPSVTLIATNAFRVCSLLSSVRIESEHAEIQDWAFWG